MIKQEAGDFYGLPTRILHSDHLRLEFLAEAGPRIVRLSLADSDENLLAEVPDFKVSTPHGDYSFRGGHRLWHAPESMPRTYVLDDDGLEMEALPDGARLTQPVESLTGIRKQIEIHLHTDQASVTLKHHLTNEGPASIELAPWAITQLRMGGVGILPQPMQALDASGLLPNRSFALWPYSRWSDSRLQLHDDFILIHAEPKLPPFKIGYLNTDGWLAYWRDEVLFCKRFALHAEENFPDFGSNAETYCGDRFFELETLGPLCMLQPGERVTHNETWTIYRRLEMPELSEAMRDALRASTSG